MAITETKIIQVNNDPSIINRANEEWGKFGWSVLSVEVTHTQNTKTYTPYYGADHDVVETTTINYATITYQRDKQMPNYLRITELEQEYASLVEELPSVKDKKNALIKDAGKFGVINIVIIVGMLILSSVFDTPSFSILTILSIILIISAIGYGVYNWKKKKAAKVAAEHSPAVMACTNRISEINARLNAITRETAQLMNIA